MVADDGLLVVAVIADDRRVLRGRRVAVIADDRATLRRRRRVAVIADDRATTALGLAAPTGDVWPSDHFGVVAEIAAAKRHHDAW